MKYLGIDIGSTTTKAVLIDAEGTVLASGLARTGAQIRVAIDDVLQQIKDASGESDFYCVSTGYGRRRVEFADKCVTEITAHARGAHFLFPEAEVIIDIGGQDSKVIGIGNDGSVDDFFMNDKCAAGTGRFLEVMAGILNVSITELGNLALQYKKSISINSTCTVFAESEVISLISREEEPADIAYAVHRSVVSRVVSMARRLHQHGKVVVTGGVCRNSAVRSIISEMLEVEVKVPEDPQLVGALGAALIARQYNI